MDQLDRDSFRCESCVGLHNTLEPISGAPLLDEFRIVLEGHPLLSNPWVEIRDG
jgi:hypothetical protein